MFYYLCPIVSQFSSPLSYKLSYRIDSYPYALRHMILNYVWTVSLGSCKSLDGLMDRLRYQVDVSM